MKEYDPLFVCFIYHFNITRDYFECHEVMEELWMEQGRSPLLQGLLQAAVGLYHHGNGNVSGSIKLFAAGIEKIEHYPLARLGIDLSKLLQDSRDYLEKLKQIDQHPFEPYDLDIRVLDEGLVRLVAELQEKALLSGAEE